LFSFCFGGEHVCKTIYFDNIGMKDRKKEYVL